MEEAVVEAVAEADGGGGGARVEYAFGWRRRVRGRAGCKRSERGKPVKESETSGRKERRGVQQGGGWVAEACLRGGDKGHEDLTFRACCGMAIELCYAINTFSRCMILHMIESSRFRR